MAAESPITQESIEKILKGITIPSPPQIIADLQMEMAMPDPDLNQMADMISKDPGLAGGVLKTLNSPFYGGHDIASISKAVMMLGMNTVTNIINTLYLRDSMSSAENISDAMYKALNHFWDSATDVARACQLVAHRLRFADAELAYMLGLFHNSGIPLLMQRFDNYPEILERSYTLERERIVDTENESFKTNHAVVSFYAAKSWKLPKVICNVIAKHHSTKEVLSANEPSPQEEKILLSILKLAENIAGLHRILGNNDKDLEWEQNADRVMEILDLTQFDYDEIKATAEDHGIGNQAYFM